MTSTRADSKKNIGASTGSDGRAVTTGHAPGGGGGGVRECPPTDGEWFIDDNEPYFTISTTFGTIIARVLVADDYPCREEGTDEHINDEARANATLMAASKVMLAALKAARGVIDERKAPLTFQRIQDAIRKAGAAFDLPAKSTS